jgi:hypothetical protein
MRVQAKRSAARTRAAFGLDVEWFRIRLDAGVCEATGLALEAPVPGLSTRQCSPWTATLDLIDACGGYVEGNARLVVRIYHNAKGHYRDDDVARMTLSHAEKVRERGWIASTGSPRRRSR